jgi:hypothetical protein
MSTTATKRQALPLPGSQSPPADFALLCNHRAGIAADEISMPCGMTSSDCALRPIGAFLLNTVFSISLSTPWVSSVSITTGWRASVAGNIELSMCMVRGLAKRIGPEPTWSGGSTSIRSTPIDFSTAWEYQICVFPGSISWKKMENCGKTIDGADRLRVMLRRAVRSLKASLKS